MIKHLPPRSKNELKLHKILDEQKYVTIKDKIVIIFIATAILIVVYSIFAVTLDRSFQNFFVSIISGFIGIICWSCLHMIFNYAQIKILKRKIKNEISNNR